MHSIFASSSLSPSHHPPRAFCFPLSSPLYNTKRPLRRREYLVAIYEFVGWMDRVKRLGLGWRLNWTPIFSLGTSLNLDGEHDTLTWNSSKQKLFLSDTDDICHLASSTGHARPCLPCTSIAYLFLTPSHLDHVMAIKIYGTLLNFS